MQLKANFLENINKGENNEGNYFNLMHVILSYCR